MTLNENLTKTADSLAVLVSSFPALSHAKLIASSIDGDLTEASKVYVNISEDVINEIISSVRSINMTDVHNVYVMGVSDYTKEIVDASIKRNNYKRVNKISDSDTVVLCNPTTLKLTHDLNACRSIYSRVTAIAREYSIHDHRVSVLSKQRWGYYQKQFSSEFIQTLSLAAEGKIKIILDTDLCKFNIVTDIMDDDVFNELKKMIKSSDDTNEELAVNIMMKYNPMKNLFKYRELLSTRYLLSRLLYGDKLKQAFASHYNLSSIQNATDAEFVKLLYENDQLTPEYFTKYVIDTIKDLNQCHLQEDHFLISIIDPSVLIASEYKSFYKPDYQLV